MVIINQELRYEVSEYDENNLLVECSDPQLLVDGLELGSGNRYTAQSNLIVDKGDFAGYIALEVLHYIR